MNGATQWFLRKTPRIVRQFHSHFPMIQAAKFLEGVSDFQAPGEHL
jgi:hypothetical protein